MPFHQRIHDLPNTSAVHWHQRTTNLSTEPKWIQPRNHSWLQWVCMLEHISCKSHIWSYGEIPWTHWKLLLLEAPERARHRVASQHLVATAKEFDRVHVAIWFHHGIELLQPDLLHTFHLHQKRLFFHLFVLLLEHVTVHHRRLISFHSEKYIR